MKSAMGAAWARVQGVFQFPSGGRAARRLALLAGMGVAALVAACGGSGAPIEPFKPTRLMVFGDDLSVIESDGRKRSINFRDANTGALDCAQYPMWFQKVGTAFGLVFAQCNPNSAAVTAQTYAQVGARSTDLQAQLDRAAAAGAFGPKQLAAVYFGLNDILELYAQYPQRPLEALVADARARGVAVGNTVNRITSQGPAVLLITAPDVGLMPFGIAQTAAAPGASPTPARVLSQLGDAFNAGLRVTIFNDGRLIGLVSSDQMVRDVQPPLTSFFGLTNIVDAACQASAQPPACDPTTLVSGADALGWAYATDRLYSAGLQGRLGDLASARALRNPF